MESTYRSQKLSKRKFWTSNNTIPLIVDNTVNLPEYNMVRFVYFSIDAAENPKPFKLKVKGQAIPFLLIGFQGIIHSPLRGTRFLSPEAIGRLFDAIEESKAFNAWSLSVIQEAKDIYPKNSELRLPKDYE